MSAKLDISSQSASSTNTALDILRLIRSENVGPRTFYDLVRFFGSPGIALNHVTELAIKGGRAKPITIYAKDKAEKELSYHKKIGAEIITYQDKNYPKLLTQLHDAPPVLSCLGNANILRRKLVSIVGARNASLNARILCKKIASKLFEAGFTVVSGLARGIDTEAHLGSIDSTIAVLAGGVDHIYPPENKDLYNTISSQGVLLAELPIGAKPLSTHFPQRNRIIAGLSRCIVVIEASLKSGSLITANFALQNNREVCAVPGFPLDYRSGGANKLIKDGAFVVDSIHSLVDHLIKVENHQDSFCEIDSKGYKHTHPVLEIKIDANMRESLLSLLSSCPIAIDDLYNDAGMSVSSVYTIILELELAGRIVRHPGNMVSLKY